MIVSTGSAVTPTSAYAVNTRGTEFPIPLDGVLADLKAEDTVSLQMYGSDSPSTLLSQSVGACLSMVRLS